MSTFSFSMELISADNNGCNFVAGPLARSIRVTGYQIAATVAFIAIPTPNAYVEGAFTGWFVSSMPTFTQPNGAGGGVLSMTNDCPPGIVINGSSSLDAVAMGIPADGQLFNRFWNTNAPNPVSIDCNMSGLSETIPKGAYLVIHAEQNSVIYTESSPPTGYANQNNYGPSNVPCDMQIAGTLFYQATGEE